MGLSLASISQGAMTAAVTLGSSLHSFGTSVATAASTIPQVTAGGMQAVAASMPANVQVGAAGSAQLASDLALVEKPAKAMATAMPRLGLLGRTANFLGKALPVVAIGASALAGAKLVDDQGAQALVTTKEGRGAVLGAVGGALLLVPHPATQIAAAGVLAGVAVNQFGGLDRLDDVHLGARSAAAAAPARQ